MNFIHDVISPNLGIIILGAAFVCVHAYSRFNTPSTNRTTTTALSYYTAAASYVVILLVVYLALVCIFTEPQSIARGGTINSPIIHESLEPARLSLTEPQFQTSSAAHKFLSAFDTLMTFNGASDIDGNLPIPLLVALGLTVLMPNFPRLSKIDLWLIERFHRMASVSYEMRRLSAELRKSQFQFSREMRKKIKGELLAEDFSQKDILFTKSTSPQYMFTKVTSLIKQLDAWQRDRRFVAFIADHEVDYKIIKQKHTELVRKAKRFFGLINSLDTSDNDKKMNKAVYEVKSNFVAETNDLLVSTCDLISRGVLTCILTHKSRTNQLVSMGFKGMNKLSSRPIPIDLLVFVFGLTSLLFIFTFMIYNPDKTLTPGQNLLKSAMISGMLCSAVFCAVILKEHKWFVRNGGNDTRRYGYYLLSGATATGIGSVISITFRILIFNLNLVSAAKDFTEYLPFLTLIFATAAVTAFSCDKPFSPNKQYVQYFDAMVQGAVTLSAALFTHFWLFSNSAPGLSYFESHPKLPGIPELWQLLIVAAIVGSLLGFLVPTWCREVTRNST